MYHGAFKANRIIKCCYWKWNLIQPLQKAGCCCCIASVMSDSVQPTRLPRPWDSPGKNTGVGCHFLLQCMKVKSESEVAQSCPTLSNPVDCSLPGSSAHRIFQARVLEWGAIACSEKQATIYKISNRDLYSAGNYTQYPVINRSKRLWKEYNIYIQVNHFAVHQKLIQRGKSTILQLKEAKYMWWELNNFTIK